MSLKCGKDSDKHKRSTSQTALSTNKKKNSSPPASYKLETKKTSTSSGGGATTSGSGAGSPKPKRNIFDGFRNPLKSKSKSQEGSAVDSCVVGGSLGVQESDILHTNVHSMPELNKSMDSDVSPAISPSATPHSGLCVRVTHDYKAQKDEEITVHKGDMVQLIDTGSRPDAVYIYREQLRGEGWIPSSVIKDQENSKKPWHMKLRKPSFTKKEATVKDAGRTSTSLDRISARKDKGHTKVCSEQKTCLKWCRVLFKGKFICLYRDWCVILLSCD